METEEKARTKLVLPTLNTRFENMVVWAPFLKDSKQ